MNTPRDTGRRPRRRPPRLLRDHGGSGHAADALVRPSDRRSTRGRYVDRARRRGVQPAWEDREYVRWAEHCVSRFVGQRRTAEAQGTKGGDETTRGPPQARRDASSSALSRSRSCQRRVVSPAMSLRNQIDLGSEPRTLPIYREYRSTIAGGSRISPLCTRRAGTKTVRRQPRKPGSGCCLPGRSRPSNRSTPHRRRRRERH